MLPPVIALCNWDSRISSGVLITMAPLVEDIAAFSDLGRKLLTGQLNI
jgi:hypothetical protein